MSRESAIAYADRLKSDESFRDQVANAGSDDERKQIITGAGFDVSSEDASTVEEALGGGSGEMSDSDLESVSGGGNISVVGSLICFGW